MATLTITLDEMQDMDRRYFLDHPTIKRFDRQYCAGEFGENYTNIVGVRVIQITEGLRVRMPILAAERKRQPTIVAAKKKRRQSSKGRSKDFRSFKPR